MDISVLKNFAQESRRYLMDVVAKKIEYYLTSDNVEIRAKKHLIEELKKEISNTSKDQVIEKIAYTWFNRFCALRYMDVKQYSLVGVLTPMSVSHTQPEILMEAKSGHIKDELGNASTRDHVIGLLSGKVSSNDPQSEAYKLLVLMVCNYYHSIMPFLFEKMDDFTELLMPDDLLSEASVISKVRDALNEENCKNVEVIGWLYQFYISEKKDAVINRRSVVSSDEIPAVTQLFTPEWIVKFIVDNSLGHLWLTNRPDSRIVDHLKFYIPKKSGSENVAKISTAKEIKLCDPACGSGHLLVYAFEVLFSIYEEEGYSANEIPSLILENNLFGFEIDKRASDLASFSLVMKCREKNRRFFSRITQPAITLIKNLDFRESELDEYLNEIGLERSKDDIQEKLSVFSNAETFGSLIRGSNVNISNKNLTGKNLFTRMTGEKVSELLNTSHGLAGKYNVVVANPPYLTWKFMPLALKDFISSNYADYKADIYSCFISRLIEMTEKGGVIGVVTPYLWMFLSSYKQTRELILNNCTISSLVQLEYNAFGPACIPVCCFTLINQKSDEEGVFIRLSEFKGEENQAPRTLEAINNPDCHYKFKARTSDFRKLPDYPIGYWLPAEVINTFTRFESIDNSSDVKQGLSTADNSRFIRYWWEVSFSEIFFDCKSRKLSSQDGRKWYPHNKGGAFRKWYGNQFYIINWKNDGAELFSRRPKSVIRNPDYYFRASVSWSDVTSNVNSFRYYPDGFIFDTAGNCAFSKKEITYQQILSLVNSVYCKEIIPLLNPSMHFSAGYFSLIPSAFLPKEKATPLVDEMVAIAENDWSSQEFSWSFLRHPFLRCKGNSLSEIIEQFVADSDLVSENLRALETKNNELIISHLNVNRKILPPDVKIEEVSLFINRFYEGYGFVKENQLTFVKPLVLSFINYFVGCVFGRYSIDEDGLIIASQGENLKGYFEKVATPRFLPDSDNVIPILNGDWFNDDIANKFKVFLKACFGEKHLSSNLKYIQEILGKDIQKYFLKDFYNDHIKMYKKRPIYWMFSTPNGIFNALIYIHRYSPDTVSIILNNYLREFRTKLNSKRENLERLSVAEATSARDKTAALKEIEQLKKMVVELDEYEKDILYPLATQRLEIDLDDGVKANYPKFGKALKPIKGLDKDED